MCLAHQRTPGTPRKVDDLQSVEFANIVGAIADDLPLTECTQICFVVTWEDQSEPHDQGTIDDFLGKQEMNEFPGAIGAGGEDGSRGKVCVNLVSSDVFGDVSFLEESESFVDS